MITFSKQITHKGSNSIQINVEKNGAPYGIIRTFKETKRDSSPWQVILLDGTYECFWGEWGKSESKRKALEKAKKSIK